MTKRILVVDDEKQVIHALLQLFVETNDEAGLHVLMEKAAEWGGNF